MNTCICGHDMQAHIYTEGACRPGFVCPAGCTQFIATYTDGKPHPDYGLPKLSNIPVAEEDEVKKMKPGRALDALVAEKVFGHKVVETRWGKQKQYGCLSIGEPDWYDDAGATELGNPVPDYSTSIVAAWEVVEKFVPYFRLECNENTDYVEPSKAKLWHCDIWVDGKDVCCVTGKTAPHAICLAALKAVEPAQPNEKV